MENFKEDKMQQKQSKGRFSATAETKFGHLCLEELGNAHSGLPLLAVGWRYRYMTHIGRRDTFSRC